MDQVRIASLNVALNIRSCSRGLCLRVVLIRRTVHAVQERGTRSIVQAALLLVKVEHTGSTSNYDFACALLPTMRPITTRCPFAHVAAWCCFGSSSDKQGTELPATQPGSKRTCLLRKRLCLQHLVRLVEDKDAQGGQVQHAFPHPYCKFGSGPEGVGACGRS
jgi:hypothetical protein